jgi:hypothetical protein
MQRKTEAEKRANFERIQKQKADKLMSDIARS